MLIYFYLIMQHLYYTIIIQILQYAFPIDSPKSINFSFSKFLTHFLKHIYDFSVYIRRYQFYARKKCRSLK